jgi:hypothetical protein
MTSSITHITAAEDGDTADQRPTEPEYGVAVLRHMEAKALISLACDALNQAFNLGYELHAALYGTQPAAPDNQREQKLDETLTCLQTAEHYLLMLGSVFEECPRTTHGKEHTPS